MQKVDPFEGLAITSRHMPAGGNAHLFECSSTKDHRLHHFDDLIQVGFVEEWKRSFSRDYA